MVMKKHKYNIFPEAQAEDFLRLKDDIERNGFDSSQPITTYEGAILDGWNRMNACQQLSITPVFTDFTGSATEAIDFVMRTNKRRSLNSGQWACIAAVAGDLMTVFAKAVEKDRREKQGQSKTTNAKKEIVVQIIEPQSPKDNSKLTDSKTADMFNTNRTYIANAIKMKEVSPEILAKVKAGTMTMQDGMKAVRAIPTDPWSGTERDRQKKVEKGQTVVANQKEDKNLIAWANEKGKAVMIDRGSKYGNPFILNDDGDRDQVCDCYEQNYLPNKPSILNTIDSLKGKVLICHCFPLRCHGDSLAIRANSWPCHHCGGSHPIGNNPCHKIANDVLSLT